MIIPDVVIRIIITFSLDIKSDITIDGNNVLRLDFFKNVTLGLESNDVFYR